MPSLIAFKTKAKEGIEVTAVQEALQFASLTFSLR